MLGQKSKKRGGVESPWLLSNEVWKRVGIPKNTFYKRCRNGEGPPSRRGRYHVQEVAAWADSFNPLTGESKIRREIEKLKAVRFPTQGSAVSLWEYLISDTNDQRVMEQSQVNLFSKMEDSDLLSESTLGAASQSFGIGVRLLKKAEAASYIRYTLGTFKKVLTNESDRPIRLENGLFSTADLDAWLFSTKSVSFGDAKEQISKRLRKLHKKTVETTDGSSISISEILYSNDPERKKIVKSYIAETLEPILRADPKNKLLRELALNRMRLSASQEERFKWERPKLFPRERAILNQEIENDLKRASRLREVLVKRLAGRGLTESEKEFVREAFLDEFFHAIARSHMGENPVRATNRKPNKKLRD